MKVKWPNIIGIMLLIAAIVVMFHLPSLLTLWAEEFNICSSSTTKSLTAVLALGLVCYTVIGVVIILSRRR